jgi:hypothetical protein
VSIPSAPPDGARLSPETRAAAARYLVRTGREDLLVVLGLAVDPVAAEKTALKAQRNVRLGKPKVNCAVCKRRTWDVWDGVCKRPDCGEVGELKRAGGAR